MGRHSTCELPPLDGRLARLLRLLCSDRRTKLTRIGRSESDMGASESPRRSLHPIASARSGFTSRPSESSRVLEPHMIWWPQPRPICTHIGPNLTGVSWYTTRRSHRNGATYEAEFGAAPGRCVFRVLHVSPVRNGRKHSASSALPRCLQLAKTNVSQ